MREKAAGPLARQVLRSGVGLSFAREKRAEPQSNIRPALSASISWLVNLATAGLLGTGRTTFVVAPEAFIPPACFSMPVASRACVMH